jgi:uncharacterized protein
MSIALEPPPSVDSFRRLARPEARKEAGWVSPPEFFRTIRYVTLKVTNGCNLKCSYCNVEADLPSTPRLSIERYKQIARLLIENSTSPLVALEFHGGEPLLLDDEWFKEAVSYAAALGKKHGKMVQHPMQTNGTRLTKERLELLLELGIQLGISCDGSPEINDRHRMAGKRVEKALQLLVERRAPFGLILVLSQSNCRDMYEVMEWFRAIGVPGFRVNFMQPQGLGLDHDLLTGQEMFTGMRAVFDHMAETDCSVMEAGIQLAVNRFVAGRDPRPRLSCWEHQCQAGRVYVAINVEGAVYSCGTDMFHHRLGHIDEGFSREHVGQTLCTLHHKDPWYIRCFSCAAKRICNQSCPTSNFNNIQYREADCEYTRLLYSYFAENAATVRRVYDTIGRWGPEANLMR